MGNELNKQTAVNYLIKEFSDILGPIETKPMQDLLIMAAIKQAKEMEKEQISDAWENGFMSTGQGWNGEVTPEMHNETLDTEQYYEQTYGGNK